MNNPIAEKIFGILSSILAVPVDRLDLHSSRDTLEQWDSLKHMTLMLALEEEFGIEFDDKEMAELCDAAALIDTISRKGGK